MPPDSQNTDDLQGRTSYFYGPYSDIAEHWAFSRLSFLLAPVGVQGNDMKGIFIGAFALFSASALSQLLYQENFDSLSANTDMQTQPGWTVWNSGQPTAGTLVVQPSGAPLAASGANCARLAQPISSSSGFYRFGIRDVSTAWLGRSSGNNDIEVSADVYAPFTAGSSSVFDFFVSGASSQSMSMLETTPGVIMAGAVQQPFTRGVWNRWEMKLSRSTGTTSYFLNGTLFATQTTTANIGFNPTGITFSNRGLSGTLRHVYIDNISFRAVSPVPEPASLATLGLGVAALIRRKKTALRA